MSAPTDGSPDDSSPDDSSPGGSSPESRLVPGLAAAGGTVPPAFGGGWSYQEQAPHGLFPVPPQQAAAGGLRQQHQQQLQQQFAFQEQALQQQPQRHPPPLHLPAGLPAARPLQDQVAWPDVGLPPGSSAYLTAQLPQFDGGGGSFQHLGSLGGGQRGQLVVPGSDDLAEQLHQQQDLHQFLLDQQAAQQQRLTQRAVSPAQHTPPGAGGPGSARGSSPEELQQWQHQQQQEQHRQQLRAQERQLRQQAYQQQEVEALFHATQGPVIELPAPGQMQIGSLLQLAGSRAGNPSSVQMSGSLVPDLGGVSFCCILPYCRATSVCQQGQTHDTE